MTETNAETTHAFPVSERWDGLWASSFGRWVLTNGVHIVLVIVAALIATRVIRYIAGRISRRLAAADHADAVVRSVPRSASARSAMVARTLPGKQFDAGRRLRQMVVAALRKAGISSGSAATVGVP